MQQKVSGKLYRQSKEVAVFRAVVVNVKVCSRLNFLSGVFLVYTDGLHTMWKLNPPISCLLVITGGYGKAIYHRTEVSGNTKLSCCTADI